MTRVLALGAVFLVLVSGASGIVAADAANPPSAGESTGSAQAAAAERSGTNPAQVGTVNQNENLRFDFEIRTIEHCGLTCRDVTVAATNTQRTTARNVEFVTQMSAGDDVVWTGNETFRKIEPGETKTATKRVSLGFFDAVKVRQNGGYLTAETTVTWDSGSESFTERRKVT
ncbi:hypothetical protein SAMN04488063_0596 [Halopelagius inordinatus]|uniref:Uncharacterized protein n=1 Tax=Halopelagius inordinatus TaxID=553467 RepID=A0A1I2M6E8_9EURY|nr:hypothetical protein [Halopelagius inordinatus]SFF87034.1 hypothetical protein SAMN04488063_0596 [Halopelagius inordinatus]